MIQCNICMGRSPNDARFCIDCGKPIQLSYTGRTTKLEKIPYTTIDDPAIYQIPYSIDQYKDVRWPYNVYPNEMYHYMYRKDLIDLAYTLSLEQVLQIGNALKNDEPIYLYGREVILLD